MILTLSVAHAWIAGLNVDLLAVLLHAAPAALDVGYNPPVISSAAYQSRAAEHGSNRLGSNEIISPPTDRLRLFSTLPRHHTVRYYAVRGTYP